MMRKSFTWLCLTSLLFAVLVGCRSAPMISLDEPQYAKVAIAPFAVEEGAEDMARLVGDLGTSLSLAIEDKEWIYDQSEQLAPIGNAFESNKLTAEEVFVDPALAAKVGESVGADLIIVGKIMKPRTQTKQDPNIYYDTGSYSVSGFQTRYVLQVQSAIEDVKMKLVIPKTGEVAWQGNVKGYTKYFREFMQQDPAKDYARVTEDQIKADMRAHLLKRIQTTLFPNRFPQVTIPEILAKPTRELLRSGGKPLLF